MKLSKMVKLNLNIYSFNCSGLNTSSVFVSDLLEKTSIDVLLFQETWLLDSNIEILGNLHSEFLFCGKAGFESSSEVPQTSWWTWNTLDKKYWPPS